MTDSTQLITIEKANALAIFSTPGEVDPILARIRSEIDQFVADVSTKRGRDDVASMAYRVAQSKTYLDGIGKALVDDLKDVPKKVDASRKRIRDTLDQWRDEVRRPLTDWEETENRRILKHRATLDRLTEIATAPNAGCVMDTTAAQFREKIDAIGKIEIGPACEEFERDYALGVAGALRALQSALSNAERREAEAAELARLRAAEVEREAREREAKEAEHREARAKAEAEKAEREAAEALEREALRRKLEEEAAARKALEDEKRAREAEEARQAEERAAAARREANKNHRAKINREARAALETLIQADGASGASDAAAVAQKIVEAIVKGAIPHVSINY